MVRRFSTLRSGINVAAGGSVGIIGRGWNLWLQLIIREGEVGILGGEVEFFK